MSEIDQMRSSIQLMMSRGNLAQIEDRLRTYMLNGTDPEELEVAAHEAVARQMKAHADLMAHMNSKGEPPSSAPHAPDE